MTSRTNLNLACLKRFTLLILILVTSPMLAQQTHVVTNLNDTGAGSLRETIVNSSFGDTITFSPSLLTSGNAIINLASPISFQHSLTIKGLFKGSDSLIISGMNTNRVFYVEASNNLIPTKLHLQDLIIKNGRHTSSDHLLDYTHGGACYISGLNKLSLDNVIMRDNHAKGEAYGGAMFLIDNDTVILKRCEFRNNTTDTTSTTFSGLGGAIVQRQGILMVDDCQFMFNHSRGLGGALRKYAGTLIIEDSKFIANKTQHSSGGAVYAFIADSVLISHSFFSKNKAKRQGGAIYLSRSGATIDNSSFIQNEAGDAGGGAISCSHYQDYKKIDIIDCTLDSNWAYAGGALNLYSGNYLVKRCYIHNNLAAHDGGAIFGYYAEISIENSTITDNQAGNLGSAFKIFNTHTSILNSTIIGTPNEHIIFKEPFGNDTLLLQSSILVAGGSNDIIYNGPHTVSLGHNIFSGTGHPFRVTTDQNYITPQAISLKPLGYYGGNTLCQPPMPGSPALNAGNPNDFSPAQNGPVFGIRDCGAAEASVSSADTAELSMARYDFQYFRGLHRYCIQYQFARFHFIPAFTETRFSAAHCQRKTSSATKAWKYHLPMD